MSKIVKILELIGQAGGVADHQRICRCLVAEGEMLDEGNPAHVRFFRKG